MTDFGLNENIQPAAPECNVSVVIPTLSERSCEEFDIARFPIVTVRTRLLESASTSATINLDLEIQFAGQTFGYKQVPFERVVQGSETRITGLIPAKLSDFKIDPPSLLTMPIKNDIPVRVDLTWHTM
jgi:hypothetical protein